MAKAKPRDVEMEAEDPLENLRRLIVARETRAVRVRASRAETMVYYCACGETKESAAQLDKHHGYCPYRYVLRYNGTVPLPSYFICTPWGIVSCRGDVLNNPPLGICLYGGCWAVWSDAVGARSHPRRQEEAQMLKAAAVAELRASPFYHNGVHGNDPDAPARCLCPDVCRFSVAHSGGIVKDARAAVTSVNNHNRHSITFHGRRFAVWRKMEAVMTADPSWEWLGIKIGEFADDEFVKSLTASAINKEFRRVNPPRFLEQGYFDKRREIDPSFVPPIRPTPVKKQAIISAPSSSTSSAPQSAVTPLHAIPQVKIKPTYVDPMYSGPLARPVKWIPYLPEDAIARNAMFGRTIAELVETNGVDGGWKQLPDGL